jgi:hypothetical protein
MGNILHSIPWTLALAMAQAGNREEVLLPLPDAMRLVLESGLLESGHAFEMPAPSDEPGASRPAEEP